MSIGPMEWVIILVVVLLLFGANKVPKLMRGLGAGVKEFKKGMSEGVPDENEEKKNDTDVPAKTGGAPQGQN